MKGRDWSGSHDLRMDQPSEIGAGLAPWAEAVVDRLEFFITRQRGDHSERARPLEASCGGAQEPDQRTA